MGGTERATFGGGCFWCLEAVFARVPGVCAVTSGYAGGLKDNPTYREVCSGSTGHAEVVQVEFDPSRVSYEALVRLFFDAHDPTTTNRQGADIGTQYRSIILCENEAQQLAARRLMPETQAVHAQPVVTKVVPLERFWPAEEHHQDYFANNPYAPYCQAVIAPKLRKLDEKGGN
jgi:peptide-methionine (S)-S-oxide reductase